ncbi:MAG: hypothetical protein MUF21_03210, partial [Gemmatimonadaceae bacterium]|nr:hypothetical protein [Gemmatimonadaceae bacterium]
VRVLRDGARVAVAPAPARGATVPWPDGSREIQLAAADSAGHESFASQPRIAGDGGRPWRSLPLGLDDASRRCLLAESCAMSGNAAPGVRTEQGGPPIRFRVRIARTGRYQLRVRYANGNGPVNTDDKAAIRTLRVDGRDAGVIVMPQRGAGAWGDLGASSAVDLALRAGLHELALVWTPHDRNMHGTVNSAIVAAIEWQALPPRPPEARR